MLDLLDPILKPNSELIGLLVALWGISSLRGKALSSAFACFGICLGIGLNGFVMLANGGMMPVYDPSIGTSPYVRFPLLVDRFIAFESYWSLGDGIIILGSLFLAACVIRQFLKRIFRKQK